MGIEDWGLGTEYWVRGTCAMYYALVTRLLVHQLSNIKSSVSICLSVPEIR